MAKRKSTAPAEPVQYLHLESSSYSEDTSEADPDDRWSRASTSTHWDIEGISLSDRDGQHALPADFDVQVGDEVFVVYVVYSTGDTFGHDDGAYLEVVSFHKDSAIAQGNAVALRARTGKQDEQFSFTIKFDNGNSVKRHCPWDGYFESLDYVRVESFLVKTKISPW